MYKQVGTSTCVDRIDYLSSANSDTQKNSEIGQQNRMRHHFTIDKETRRFSHSALPDTSQYPHA